MTNIGKNTKYQSWDVERKEWYFPDHEAEPIYIGNTEKKIDWDSIIDFVQGKNGMVLPKLIWSNPHFEEMKKLYIDSNYIIDSAEWINYYPEKDYDPVVNKKFGEIIGKPKCVRAWISRINPGKTAPWHWDLDDQEEEYLKNGKLVRYICKMNNNSVGQVTILGNHAIKDFKQGDIIRWPDHRIWHGSVNCGLTPKYQFNYLAYE